MYDEWEQLKKKIPKEAKHKTQRSKYSFPYCICWTSALPLKATL